MAVKDENLKLKKEVEVLKNKLQSSNEKVDALKKEIESIKAQKTVDRKSMKKELILDKPLPLEIDPKSKNKESINYYLERWNNPKTPKKDKVRLYNEMRRNLALQYKSWEVIRSKEAFMKAEEHLETMEVKLDE